MLLHGYAAAAIGNEIFYYGGYCGHDNCNHNSLYSFNMNTFNWKELSPTTFRDAGPMRKWHCGMAAVRHGAKYFSKYLNTFRVLYKFYIRVQYEYEYRFQ